jgi:hypothetical protein
VTNALQSLYGAADAANARALAGNVGGQVRTQEVLTPGWILRAAAVALDGIDYDPCASTDPANWFATTNVTLSPEGQAIEALYVDCTTKAERRAVAKAVRPFYWMLPPHLSGSSFVNPPFGTTFLDKWMKWCCTRAAPTIGLWPVRTHRPWWIKYSAGAEIVLLRYDVKFRGHKCAFPAPLCLAAWHCQVPDLGAKETGRWTIAA